MVPPITAIYPALGTKVSRAAGRGKFSKEACVEQYIKSSTDVLPALPSDLGFTAIDGLSGRWSSFCIYLPGTALIDVHTLTKG